MLKVEMGYVSSAPLTQRSSAVLPADSSERRTLKDNSDKLYENRPSGVNDPQMKQRLSLLKERHMMVGQQKNNKPLIPVGPKSNKPFGFQGKGETKNYRVGSQ